MYKTQRRSANSNKVYLEVNADYEADGALVPRSFSVDDEETYKIDKILDVRPAASLKAGGVGMRYRVRVMKQEVYLFLEEDNGANRWFMERM